jgi:hypothetical protein
MANGSKVRDIGATDAREAPFLDHAHKLAALIAIVCIVAACSSQSALSASPTMRTSWIGFVSAPTPALVILYALLGAHGRREEHRKDD